MSSENSSSLGHQSNLLRLDKAVIVVPTDVPGPHKKAITMLIEEVEKRTQIRWGTITTWPSTPIPVIAVGSSSALNTFAGQYTDELSADGDTSAPEGYRIRVRDDGGRPVVLVIGNDARGVLFGVGHLLRTLRTDQGSIALPDDLNVTTAPYYRLRGHQLGYRDKTNSYCGWDLPQWEQYIRDLVVFGANAIELIPPRSDDHTASVHFPLPPMKNDGRCVADRGRLWRRRLDLVPGAG